MFELYTFPTLDILKELEEVTPTYMRPNRLPYAVIGEGYLNNLVCNEIVDLFMLLEVHVFPGCEAITRESPMPLLHILDPIAQFARKMNDEFWNFDLDEEPAAYMQTYYVSDKYRLHMDGNAGQTRKISAIVQLTDPNDYEGGDLILTVPPHRVRVPNKQGTIVIFPHWLLHEVTEITSGMRQTINMGFWGPPLR